MAILCGLVALHEAGYIFCDLKPDNVMISSDGRVVLIDYGACVAYQPDDPLDVHEKTMYYCPEVAMKAIPRYTHMHDSYIH